MKEDILDRRASTPPSVYKRTSFFESMESNENENDNENEKKSSSTEIFKKNEKENEIMMSNNCFNEIENENGRISNSA